MQKIFSDLNIAKVGLVRSYLDGLGIQSQLRNEYAAGVMGDLPFSDVWPELWVDKDQAKKAHKLISQMQSTEIIGLDWSCQFCQELNPNNFEICWQCRHSA